MRHIAKRGKLILVWVGDRRQLHEHRRNKERAKESHCLNHWVCGMEVCDKTRFYNGKTMWHNKGTVNLQTGLKMLETS